MNIISFYIPFVYFVKTRLNTKAAIIFHTYAEFLLGILLLMYAGIPLLDSIRNFFFAYVAFISIYEIGYIVNDNISVRFEKDPRKRLKAMNPTTAMVGGWIIVRLLVFLALTFYLNLLASFQWWLFYILLTLVFITHNLLRQKELKIFTFISLAFFRFYAPLFPFLPVSFIEASVGGILLFYVFFRTLTYIDSKGLLAIPSRTSFSFKMFYYLVLVPVSGGIYVLTQDALLLWINLYFLIFWVAFYIADSFKAFSKNGIQHSEA